MTGLAFRRVSVRRMPGIADGGFDIEGLSPGLNVVHGPNASGKTTTTRAIEALLWPRCAPQQAWLSAGLEVDGGAWTVRLDGRQARWQRDGIDAAALVAPAEEARDRYRISLHELLAAEDVGFARVIARESAGGYDLTAAARVLNPRTSASRCTGEVGALREAEARLEAATRAQEALFDEERQLRRLEDRLGYREELATRIRLLELAVEHALAREAAARAEVALEPFDARMERLHGDEAARLRAIAEKLSAARADSLAAEQDEQRARAALSACGLPEGGLPAELLSTLEHELEALQEQDRAIAALERARAAAEARRERERAAIGTGVDADRLTQLSVDGIASLAGFAREAAKVAATRTALQGQLDELGAADPPAHEREVLENGARVLRQWLRGGPGGEDRVRRVRTLGVAAAVALVVAGVGLALLHPLLAVVALGGGLLLALVLRVGMEPDPRPVHQGEFGRLGLAAPAAWTVEAVERRLAELDSSVAAARLAEERARRRGEVVARIEANEPREREIEARRREIAGQLGLGPKTLVEELAWLVERIGRWHDAHAEVVGASAAVEAARARLDSGLQRASGRMQEYGGAAIDGVAALAGALEELERRQEQLTGARSRLDTARVKRSSATGAIATLEEERAEIFARLELDPAEAATVDAWCAALDEHRAARQEERRTAAVRDAAQERLPEISGFDPSLLVEDEGTLKDRLALAREEAADLDRLRDEATEIRTRIAEAKKAHAIEEALAEVERCRDALRAARKRDIRSVLASALVDFVQGATRDQHLPAVFHRARDLFVRITHGRYRLDFDDGDPPAFRAFDSHTGMGHPLEELSSATRIQLLLAVRLAFVETQEQGVRLPLLFDETLGNSDDARAAAIMETLLELTAQGRQVFYFTAQPDEVGKWRGMLESRPEVPAAFVDLAEVRRLSRSIALPGLRVVGAPRVEVPAPDGVSHEEYGEVLGIPPLDPFAPVDTVHLWYLVEDTAALHRLLVEVRVERWGALRSLVDHGAGSLVDRAVFGRAAALARALGAALEAWRVGRGRPVDRPVLEASGAITDKFMDAIVELCREHDGDARPVLEALGRGDVKHFRTSARDDLQAHFEEHGYLDASEPLDVEALRMRALAAVDEELDRGDLEVDEVDRLLARMELSLSVPVPTL